MLDQIWKINITFTSLIVLANLMCYFFLIKYLFFDNKLNKKFFNLKINFLSKNIKNLNLNRFWITAFSSSLFNLGIWLFFLESYSSENSWFNDFIYFIIINLINESFLLLTFFYIRYKKIIYETNNEVLLIEFKTFKEEWIKKYGNQEIRLNFNQKYKIIQKLYSSKYNNSMYMCISWSLNTRFKLDTYNNYYRVIDYFRIYLNSYRFNDKYLTKNCTFENEHNFSIKEVAIHNFLVTLHNLENE